MKRNNFVAFANEFVTPKNNDEKNIRIPFGQWPFGIRKNVAVGNRVVARAFYEQKFDRESAEAVLADIAQITASGAPGIPVYIGHPDVDEFAKFYADKGAKGWIVGGHIDGDALVLDVDWLENPGRAFGWHSPVWRGATVLTNERTTPPRGMVYVREIQSVGLVNRPRIRDFLLANEDDEGFDPVTQQKEDTNIMDKNRIIALLKLPAKENGEEYTDEELFAELTRVKNAEETAQTQVNAAEADAEKAKEEFANERAAHKDLILANALADGRITPPQKTIWANQLDANFDAGTTALANLKPIKTGTVFANSQDPRATAAAKENERTDFVNALMVKHSLDYNTAWARAKRENPALFA